MRSALALAFTPFRQRLAEEPRLLYTLANLINRSRKMIILTMSVEMVDNVHAQEASH